MFWGSVQPPPPPNCRKQKSRTLGARRVVCSENLRAQSTFFRLIARVYYFSIMLLNFNIYCPHLWLSTGTMFDSGPGLIPGSWIMMRHVSCIFHLEWSTTSQRLWPCGCIGFLSPMHKKIPVSYSKREGGNPGNSRLSSQQ